MVQGVFRNKDLKVSEQFLTLDDEKLRLTIVGLADKYNEQIRELIYRAYNDPKLMHIYHTIRTSGIYQHGSKDRSKRKILEFPNPWVYDFVNTALTALYGPDWLKSNKALKHDLVRPWWVVEKL